MVTARIGNSIGREMVVVGARDSETRRSDPKVVDLMLRARSLGFQPISQKRYDEQQLLYREVLRLDANHVQALSGLALAALNAANNLPIDPATEKKQTGEACALALRAKELAPNEPSVYAALGTCAGIVGDAQEDVRLTEVALGLDPKNPTRYNSLAVSYFYLGQPARAIDLLARGLQLDPRGAKETLLVNMGRSHFMLGNDSAAIEWLSKARDKNTNWGVTHAYLAMAYARTGNGDRSRAAASALLRLEPTFRLAEFETAEGLPIAYQELRGSNILVAGRLAGLPE
jgi:tetratricopeptide (TPR) repeat protein